MTNIQDIMARNKYSRSRLTEYGLKYIEDLKTPESWLRLLRFAKYRPPKHIRKCLLKPGFDDGWENFVFRIKNNLILILMRNEYLSYNSEFREFKIQVALYEKIRASTIIQRSSMEKTDYFS